MTPQTAVTATSATRAGTARGYCLAMTDHPVRELRVCVTAEDYDEAVTFYRDVLGLRVREAYSSPTAA